MKINFTLFLALSAIMLNAVLGSCTKLAVEELKKTPTGDSIKVVAVDSLKVGLIAYYTFNNTGADSSGKKNDGKVYSINSTTDRFGRTNSAYYFDGITSYIQVKDNQDMRLSNTDFTVNTWVNLVEYNQSFVSGLLIKRKKGPNNGWGLSITGYASPIYNGVMLGVASYGPGNASANAYSMSVFAPNQWYMISSVYSLKDQKLTYYVNGVFDGVTTNIPTPNPASDGDLFIGRDNPDVSSGYFLKGSLDEMRIYNRALSASEIKKLYLLQNN